MYSSDDTDTCRSPRITLGIIPNTTATSSNGTISMNSRREISRPPAGAVYDRYREYAPNAMRLYR